MQKARNKNIQILEYLIEQKISKSTRKELQRMGFDESAGHIPYKNNKGFWVYRYGNVGLRILNTSDNEVELVTFKQKIDDII